MTIWGVSVWALVGCIRGEGNPVELTAEAYGLREVAVRAVLACYRRNRDLIDSRLRLHDAYADEASGPVAELSLDENVSR